MHVFQLTFPFFCRTEWQSGKGKECCRCKQADWIVDKEVAGTTRAAKASSWKARTTNESPIWATTAAKCEAESHSVKSEERPNDLPKKFVTTGSVKHGASWNGSVCLSKSGSETEEAARQQGAFVFCLVYFLHINYTIANASTHLKKTKPKGPPNAKPVKDKSPLAPKRTKVSPSVELTPALLTDCCCHGSNYNGLFSLQGLAAKVSKLMCPWLCLWWQI